MNRRMLLGSLLAATTAGGLSAIPEPPVRAPLPIDPDELLDVLAVRYSYAWYRAARWPSGLILDRIPNREDYRPDHGRSAMSSIAATGFALAMLPEWVRRGCLPEDQAKAEAEQTLRFLVESCESWGGLPYHFLDARTGRRWSQSEVGTLDGGILIHGAMVISTWAQGRVAKLAETLIQRAEWRRFTTKDPATGAPLLALGWSPGRGLLTPMDSRSSESACAYFAACADGPHAVSPDLWYRTVVRHGTLCGRFAVLNPDDPLFTSYYGLCFQALEGYRDRDGVDLHANARAAALANRCVSLALSKHYPSFDPWWGLSAGDTPGGYQAISPADVDGTVFPTAALGAYPFIPERLRQDLKAWRAHPEWERGVCGGFGLNAFRRFPGQDWTGDSMIGIDILSMALAVANARAGTAWELWRRHPAATSALKRLGFQKAKAL